MEGRWFAERQLKCYYWDGSTDFTVKEDAKVEEQRLENFGDWVEDQELPEELQMRVEGGDDDEGDEGGAGGADEDGGGDDWLDQDAGEEFELQVEE